MKTDTIQKHIVVIGGGAAGMMAALFAARGGARVTLVDGNEKLGKKLYITGKGRCNLTNDAEPEAFMKQIVRNPRFLYSALALMDNIKLMRFIEDLGVPLKVERGGRVFPASDHASDINRALDRALSAEGVKVRLNAAVEALMTDDERITGVRMQSGEQIPSDAVILATGGLSYPATGSTGDGLRMAEETGHALVATKPVLTSIRTNESWPAALSGLTLKNISLSAYRGKKRVYKQQGELLFTHTGISGPLVLTVSSLLPDDLSAVRLLIDLKPALDEPTLNARLLRDFGDASRKQLQSVLDGLAPHSLAQVIAELAGVPAQMPVHSVTHAQRTALIQTIKALPLTVKALGGYEEAVITRGGVSTKEINPSTMESKRVQGLYFAGELIDVDALTGGFNLQIAFSTGALAGKSAANAREGGDA